MAILEGGAPAPDAEAGQLARPPGGQPMGLPGLNHGTGHGGQTGGLDPSAASGNAYTQLNYQQINVAPVIADHMQVDPASFNDLANVAAANANNATRLGAAVSDLHNTTANLAAGMEHLRANHAGVTQQLAQIAEMLGRLTMATGTTSEAVASAARSVETAASRPASPPPGMAQPAGAVRQQPWAPT